MLKVHPCQELGYDEGMKPPTSVLGKAIVAVGAVFGASWIGAAINSRRVAKTNPAAATAAAAVGAVTGGFVATAVGAGVALTKDAWNTVGAYTAFAGSAGYALSALMGIGPVDRVLAKAAATPKVLTAAASDSGKTFQIAVGDSLAVALPQAQGGASWVWSETPQGVLSAPAQSTQAVAGGTNEIDTFTASGNGTVSLKAELTPSGGGASTATWTAQVVVGNGINAPVSVHV